MATRHAKKPTSIEKHGRPKMLGQAAVQSMLPRLLPPHVGIGLSTSPNFDSSSDPRSAGFEKRRREFRIGRACAVQALRQAGWISNSQGTEIAEVFDEQWLEELQSIVGVGADRCPLWPAGYVGSISHSQNWTWAIAASSNLFQSFGVDTEATLTDETHELVRQEVGSEREWDLLVDVAENAALATTILFSAKETFFKLWYPLTKQFLNFEDVQLVQIQTSREWSSNLPSIFAGHSVLSLNSKRSWTDAAARPDQATLTHVRAIWANSDVFTAAWIDR